MHGADEIWTFLDGAPLCLLKHPDSERKTESCLLHRENPVACVPAGVWMAARSEGDFSLVSCCVGPGFSFDDFEMLRDVDIYLIKIVVNQQEGLITFPMVQIGGRSSSPLQSVRLRPKSDRDRWF